ncbi:hypothetical protein RIF29_29666 [Crotalaria pallida]|uniref:Uncharacterized protein n=1 Tax=Crotalaria pallida TaxID=3830 RepID=A0AAN9EF65_CROPI
MKNTNTFTLFALFFLVAITTHLPSATAQPVLDTEGNPLRNGGTYYILPVIRGFGGGIELAQTGNDTCPLTVALSRSEVSDGIPITISSLFRILFVTERSPLELSFSDTDLPSCIPTPPKWNIVKGETAEGWSIKVTDDDSEQEPGWFYIQKYDYGAKFYQLVFRSHDDAVSGDIGIDFDSDGTKRLVVTRYNKYPFLVQFKLADDDSSRSVAA